MYKVKNFFNLDKEAAWLSDMSAQGWYLCKKNMLGYTFFPSDQGRQDFQIDYREFNRKDDYLDYLSMFQDAGWIHVAGTRWTGAQYFVPGNLNTGKELFSDSASKAARYRRVGYTWLTTLIVYIPILVSLSLTGSINLEAMLHPADLYYTPGLWQMEGLDFIKAFLFETPFALGRGFFWLIIPVFMAFCLYNFLRAWSLGRKTTS